MAQISKILENPVIYGAVVAFVYVLVIWLVVRLAKRIVQGRVQDTDLRYRISKSISFAGYLLVLLVVLSGVAGKFSGLSVALGAASAGVAFALQEVIASFAGWLAIAFGNFFKVGDRVKLGGIHGDVIDIGFLRTTVMECGGWVNGDLHNGRVVRVANSFVFKEPVFNYSGEFPFLWDEITVPIKYGSRYEEASQVLEGIAREVTQETADSARSRWKEFVKAYRIEDSSVDPLVTMVANDNWVEFTVRYVVDFRRRRTTKDALFRKILAAVEGSEGRLGMASMTVHLVETPTLDVRLSRRALPQVS